MNDREAIDTLAAHLEEMQLSTRVDEEDMHV